MQQSRESNGIFSGSSSDKIKYNQKSKNCEAAIANFYETKDYSNVTSEVDLQVVLKDVLEAFNSDIDPNRGDAILSQSFKNANLTPKKTTKGDNTDNCLIM